MNLRHTTNNENTLGGRPPEDLGSETATDKRAFAEPLNRETVARDALPRFGRYRKCEAWSWLAMQVSKRMPAKTREAKLCTVWNAH